MILLDIQVDNGWQVTEHLISGIVFLVGAVSLWGGLVYTNEARRLCSKRKATSESSPPNQLHNDLDSDAANHMASLTARIQELEATQDAMLRMLPDMFLRVREDGTYVEMLSCGDVTPIYTGQDMRGMAIDEVLPEAIATSMKYYLHQALSSGTVQTFEQTFEQNGINQYEQLRIVTRQLGEALVSVRDISEQKRAEQTLVESERLNRTLLDALPDLIIRMKRDGTYLDVRSPKSFNLMCSAKPGANVRDILPAADAQKRLAMAEQAIETKQLQTYEFPLEVDGTWRWQEACIVALNDDEVIVVVRDMTIQKNALEKLRQKEAEQEAILSALPDLIFRLRSDGVYLGYVQTNVLNDILPSEFEPVGQRITHYLSPDHAQRSLNAMRRALQTQAPQVYEQEVLADGQIQYEEVRVVASGDDEVVFIIRDISDRKRSEIERSRMKVQLQQQLNRVLLFEQIANEIRGSLNSDRIFQVTVDQIGRAFGVSRCLIHSYVEGTDTSPPRIPFVAEFIDKGYAPLIELEVPLVENPHTEHMMAQDGAIASNNVYEDSTLIYVHDLCRRIELKSMLSCRTSYMGRPNGALGLHQCDRFRTWTLEEIELLEAVASQVGIALYHAHLLEQEVKQRNELAAKNHDLEKAKYEAEAANRAKTTFLATMSHELRTPLNIILGFAQVIYSSPILPEEHREDANLIIESGEHLLGLINSVLELSKIEAGMLPLHEQVFDLGRFVHSIQLMFSQKIQQKGLQFQVERSPLLPQCVIADEGKIRQILINLLNNAIKFTDQGGIRLVVGCVDPVTTNAEQHSEADSSRLDSKHLAPPLSPEQAGDRQVCLTFDVIDTGQGIALEELEKIFDAFAQTELGRESAEGTGLGLTISRKFAQLMGGTITVQSTVGKGSCFSVMVNARVDSEQLVRGAIAPRPSDLDLHKPSAEQTSQHGSASQRISPVDLHHLPSDWVNQLYDASVRCDGYAAQELIQQLGEDQRAIAQDLSQLVHSFQFDAIAALIEQSKDEHHSIPEDGITNPG